MLDVTPSPWVRVLSQLLTGINVLWLRLAVSPPGEESGRKASAVPVLLLSLVHELGVALRMFSGACRECSLSWRGLGDHRFCGCGTFREAFLFFSCLARKKREEENSGYT